ncbi:MAG: hypothetical protein A6F71_09400 [Cycloclasticus sp. symbiont of Poecilosclerida sp. M]|nr:MAG: hypothetical protein A6F71_09400 [Cycloclasticus sp. symbiont of Poecilosclerida sp. M]
MTMNEEESNFTLESVNTSLKIPSEVINSSSALFFTTYRTPALFQVVPPQELNRSSYNVTTDTMVLGFSIPEKDFTNLSSLIIITLQSIRARENKVSTTFPMTPLYVHVFVCIQPWSEPVCVSWDFNGGDDGELIMHTFSFSTHLCGSR